MLMFKSLKHRKVTAILTILTIAMSTFLLVGVERLRSAARSSFEGTISQTDLIVGARSGAVQLLLYSVFRLGSATNNISYSTFEEIKNHPAVAWAIPYSLGDSYRGYRVVGTNEDFFKYYRFQGDRTLELSKGEVKLGLFDVILGWDVAQKLSHQLSDKIIIAHGISEGRSIFTHDDKPFKVTGILGQTGTPIDRSVYISLQGMEAIHMDWTEGAPPLPGQALDPLELETRDIEISQITSILLRTKNRIDTLRLQREINTNPQEPLMAIIPGVVLSELWNTVAYAENALKIVSYLVFAVAALTIFINFYSSLNERRREMAILRSLGSGPLRVMGLLLLEACLLAATGCILGYGLMLSSTPLLQPYFLQHFALTLPKYEWTTRDAFIFIVIVVLGAMSTLIPAMKAYTNTLSDGLTIRL